MYTSCFYTTSLIRIIGIVALLAFVACESAQVTGTVEKPPAENLTAGRPAAEDPNAENPDAVQEVLDGKRTEANAAWWGFNETDVTDALQSAINSGAEKLIVPNMGKEWIVRRIFLASDQEIEFEDGVVIKAKRGEFKGKSYCLFRATGKSNITLLGYGATFQMWKSDYQNPDLYEKAEWRMTLMLKSCTNITVMGLTMKDSGGDGIYVGNATTPQPYCKDIYIKDVVCDNNHRQGMSIISVENLLVEDCVFKNTSGTAPRAGVDLESNNATERLVNCVFRNCSFMDNEGAGITMYFKYLSEESEDISIRFENCYVSSMYGYGINIGSVRDTGPSGTIEFENCVVENTNRHGLIITDKSADKARVKFTNCTWRNVNFKFHSPYTALWLYLAHTDRTQKLGGIDFIDCFVEDTKLRPFLKKTEYQSDLGIYDITGNITVSNPRGVTIDLGDKTYDVTLEVHEQESPLFVE